MSAAAGGAQLELDPGPSSPPTGTGSPAPTSAELCAWMDHAACRGVGVAVFFGTPGEMARARARCGVCPVAEICLWWAITVEADVGYRFGIWGGASPAGRARIARVTGTGYARARLVERATRWAATAWQPAAETTVVA